MITRIQNLTTFSDDDYIFEGKRCATVCVIKCSNLFYKQCLFYLMNNYYNRIRMEPYS